VKKIFLILGILVVTLGGARTATAESPQGMVVTPPTFEIAGNPGGTIKNSIRVDNLTDAPLELTVDRRNFTALDDKGEVGLTDEESSFSLAKWIAVSPDKATIPAKASQTFNFTVTIPANAEPGGRFGSIVFKTVPKPMQGSSGLAVGQEIGALLLLRIAGDVTEKASIQSFKPAQSFMEYGPVNFSALIKNEGNVHAKPTGNITVTDMFGNKVASVPVDSKNILPGAARQLEGSLPNQSLFGQYTATLSLQYGTNQQILTASSTFVVIPYKMILLWVAGIGLIGFLVYLRRDRFLKAFKVLRGKE
jgi:hypothetical protein